MTVTPDESTPDEPTRAADRPRDAVTTATELTKALRENTDAVNKVMRRQRIQAVFILVAVIAAVSSIYGLIDIRDARHVDCARDNEMRTGLLHMADYIEKTISPEDLAKASPEEIDAAYAFLKGLRTDFALREC